VGLGFKFEKLNGAMGIGYYWPVVLGSKLHHGIVIID
jgi:hypothetical protein